MSITVHFAADFGPDKLSSLDGIALLETMHSHGSKDSLVYWLEFKNDDEFPSPEFGSIAGGSAFKFGLFRKAENGIWTTGAPTHPIELSVEQAIEKARQHRDQLLAGCRLLENLPDHSTDKNYEQLQQDMNSVAPDVSNSAWGHKYFSLLYPEKMDDFHNPDYQRFHLIKLLQLPTEHDGRYIMGGRFVAIATISGIPMNTLTSLLNVRDGGTPYSYWRIGTGKSRDHWPMMRDGNCIAIGWFDVGNLTKITNDKVGKEMIRQALLSNKSITDPGTVGKATQQIFNFRWTITKDDLVLASDGATVLGVGRVMDGYSYEPTNEFPHRRPVEWLSLEQWQQLDRQPDIEGKLTTVYRMKRDANLLEVERRIYTVSVDLKIPPVPSMLPPLSGVPSRIEAVLERKGQIILYGPPGTGKTYWAELTAEVGCSCKF